jgi:hypothetical protein
MNLNYVCFAPSSPQRKENHFPNSTKEAIYDQIFLQMLINLSIVWT